MNEQAMSCSPATRMQLAVPTHLIKQWESSAPYSRELTLENLEQKLNAAATRREHFLRRTRRRLRPSTPNRDSSSNHRHSENNTTNTSSALAKLEQRLAAAAAKRSASFAAIRARAAAVAARQAHIASHEASRRRQLAMRLEESLKAADAARQARLAETVARAARRVDKARVAAQEAKAAAEIEATEKLAALQERLERAERSRQAHLGAKKRGRMALCDEAAITVAADTPLTNSIPATTLFPDASKLLFVRQKSAARSIQRAWRRYSTLKASLRTLVEGFVATGIPFTVPLTNDTTEISSGLSSGDIADDDSKASSPSSASTTTAPASLARSVSDAAQRAAAAAAAATSSIHYDQRPVRPPATHAASVPPQHRPAMLSFDDFAEAMSSVTTLRAVAALLKRFAKHAKAHKCLAPGGQGLLRKLFPKMLPEKQALLDRYQPRAFLSAYMVVAHPEVVLHGHGPREEALVQASTAMLVEFEQLLRFISPPDEPAATSGANKKSFSRLLSRFDRAWVDYLGTFLAWRGADAAGLEAELIRAAVELESSRLAKLAAIAASGRGARHVHDLAALAEGVDTDLKLISERIVKLRGPQGVARLDAALTAARAASQQQQAASGDTTRDSSMDNMSPRSTNNSGNPLPSQRSMVMPNNNSPSQSPVKKSSRLSGAYHGPSGSNAAAKSSCQDATTLQGISTPSPVAAAPTNQGTAACSSPLQETASSPAPQQVDNLSLMWQLLYDPAWRLSSSELETCWKDALGETNPLSTENITDNADVGGDGGSGTNAELSHEQQLDGMRLKVRRITEKAFWDAIQEQLAAGAEDGAEASAAAASRVAALLVDLGSQLAGVLPANSEPHREIIERLGDVNTLKQRLSSTASSGQPQQLQLLPGINTATLFELLDWTSTMLRDLGAPSREEQASFASQLIRSELAAVASSNSTTAAAAVVTKALRLLASQLSLLRIDIANAHIGALSARLGVDGAVEYARNALSSHTALGPFVTSNAPNSENHAATTNNTTPSPYNNDTTNNTTSLSATTTTMEEMVARLPHTRGWLAVASGTLPHVEHLMTTNNTTSNNNAETPGATALPGNMRSGLQGSPLAPSLSRSTTTSSSQMLFQTKLKLASPMRPRSWQGLVRRGLVQLVSGEGAVNQFPLPETLQRDAGRLFAAQNEFQRILVLNACLLAISQLNITVTYTTSQVSADVAVRRLGAVLLANDVNLAAVATEVASLVMNNDPTSRSSSNSAQSDQNVKQYEATVHAMLKSMLSRNSPAMRAISSGLGNTLTALLLNGISIETNDVAIASLIRCGAMPLKCHVAALAEKLEEVAAVTEAVCEPWYSTLCADLLVE